MAETAGQAAYEGYKKSSGNVSLVSGTTLPDWQHLSADIRDAWELAASAVLERLGPGDGSSGVRF